ncbi:TonB-dependent receptor, partial [candidate division KSB1 bacterium]|nr:TonB-dependent receptor [candidate division KSB1 bacterium]NIS26156.1 TonB-dependent receptor [candidate division KSB1 bacterium]NIT72921.1 TonB-dependent receptor [candidate division KSB1 bacterium]NIU26795.1 TonB-dependent receptor [candidate division KSB1 bacterium]NIU90606.1 TonB-dependent receptor [candidate division KSB1 bacterium]
LLYEAEQGGFGAGGVLRRIGNAEIEPERVKELELGFDAEFFANYALELSYYSQDIEDSIILFRNAPSTGKTRTSVPFNIGQASGRGIETLFQGSPIRTKNFGLDFTLINSFQDNEVDDLGGAQPIFDGFDINVVKEGLRK